MTIIVQAGHKTSKSKQVMEKLYERGLSRPNDSYTHKMTSEQVSETLYKVLSRENISVADEKIADNIMTDFLLANLDSENWGWESDKNLANLEYWEQVEPNVQCILVFDHPKNIFNSIEDRSLLFRKINEAIEEWIIYHKSLLSFFKSNNGGAVLVEGAAAVHDIQNLNDKLKGAGSKLSLENITKHQSPGVNVSEKKLLDFLYECILNSYPKCISLFNELIEIADIKISEIAFMENDINDYVSFLKQVNYDSSSLEAGKLEVNNILLAQVHSMQDKVENLSIENNLLKNKINFEGSNNEIKSYDKAIDIIKNDLPYRLGSSLVKSANAPLSMIMLPIEMFDQYQGYIKMLKDNASNSILIYDDNEEVNNVKKHLSYQLGVLLVQGFESPKDFMLTPFRLAKKYIYFRVNMKRK